MSDSEKWNTMLQYGPFPYDLEDLVMDCVYRPGWTVELKHIERDPASTHGSAAGGLTLIITTKGYDSYHPERGETYRVHHYKPVPAATFNRASWQRWLFEQFLEVERHEAAEFFVIEGKRPFAPTHGPGHDPYAIVQYAEDVQRRTSFRGIVKD